MSSLNDTHPRAVVGEITVDGRARDSQHLRDVGRRAYPSRTTALVVLEGDATPGAERTDEGPTFEQLTAAMVATWGTGEYQRVLNPDMPWNEEVRAALARWERGAASPGTVALMMPLVAEMDVRAFLPTIRVPTLVVHHADGVMFPPRRASTSLSTYPARNMLRCRAATVSTN